jgi:hypothetical protein
MKEKTLIFYMGVLVQVIDTVGVEKRCSAFDTVDVVPFLEQKFSQISAILAGYSGNQGYFFHFDLSRVIFSIEHGGD